MMASISAISPDHTSLFLVSAKSDIPDRPEEAFSRQRTARSSSSLQQQPYRVDIAAQTGAPQSPIPDIHATDQSPRSASAAPAAKADASSPNIDAEELKQIKELQRRDAEVRSHEQAHLAAAGQYAAGGPSYTFQVGPNGKRYAIGGEVPISVSKESTPEETLQKMQIVSKAALAPLNPSSADRRIAAQAAVLAAQARREIQAEAVSPATLDARIGESSSAEDSATDEYASSRSASVLEGASTTPSSVADSNLRQMALKAYQHQSAQ